MATDIQENQYNELVIILKKTISFLRKLSIILSISKGQDQKLINGNDFAEISKELLNSHEYVLLNVKDFYQKYKYELSKNVNSDTDINHAIVQMLPNCLLIIINLLQDENGNMKEIFKYFLDLKKCIFAFSTTTLIVNTSAFKNLVNKWIADLLKIITGGDGIKRNCPNDLVILNVIREILTHLAKYDIYSDLILLEISKHFECALSYCALNEELSDYLASHTLIFEYLLWIMKRIVYDSGSFGKIIENTQKFKIQHSLEMLAMHLEGKCPSAISNLIDNILRFF